MPDEANMLAERFEVSARSRWGSSALEPVAMAVFHT